jgi:hypothetical protein
MPVEQPHGLVPLTHLPAAGRPELASSRALSWFIVLRNRDSLADDISTAVPASGRELAYIHAAAATMATSHHGGIPRCRSILHLPPAPLISSTSPHCPLVAIASLPRGKKK